MSAGQFLGKLFQDHEKKAKEAQDKFDQERQGDIAMYQKVLFDPNSSPEQRTKAAQQIEKLRNIKGKDAPISKLAGILNIFGGAKKEAKGQAGTMGETSGMPSGQSPLDKSGAISELEKPAASKADPDIPPAKKNIIQRGLTKLTHGLGSTPSRTLPPLDTSVIPTLEQASSRGMAIETSEKKQRLTSTMQAWSDSHGGKKPDDKQQEAIFDSVYGIKSGTVTGRTFTKKATIVGKDIPQGTTDIYGNQTDPTRTYDFFENGQGDTQYIPLREKQGHITLADETGKPAEFAFDPRDPTKLVKIGAKPEQAEYKIFTDPNTQEQYAKPVPRFVNKSGIKGSSEGGDGKPKPKSQLTPISQAGASNGQPKKSLTPLQSPHVAVSKLDKLGKEATSEYKGIPLGKKDTTTARAKAEQALVVISQGEDLIKQIEASRDALGPFSGRISSFEAGLGSADEKVRGLYTSLKSFAALQPALHGSRGIGMQKEFENASGKLADNPDAAIAAIRSLMNTAKHFAEVGGEGQNVKKERDSKAVEKELEEFYKKNPQFKPK